MTKAHPLQQFAYVAAFRCVGDVCEDTCCKGWGMQVDDHHKKLFETKAPELLSTIEPGEAALVMRRDPTTDYCVKFDNGWCGIHRDYGEKFLGDACHFYPRVTRQCAGNTLMSATMSCPEIIRLLLQLPDPFARVDTHIDRMPQQLRSCIPPELNAQQAMAVVQGLVTLVSDDTITAERAMARLITVAFSLSNVPVSLWPTGVEVGLATAEMRLLPAQEDTMDVYTLVQALMGLLHASKKTARPRLDATLQQWQTALGMQLDVDTFDVLLNANATDLPHTLTARWQQRAQSALASALKRWIGAQITMGLFPFGGFGGDIRERIITMAVRFASLRWALMAHMADDGTAPDEATILRVMQSLSRFLDHLADPTLAMQYYTQAGWTHEPRLRALVGDVTA